MSSRTRSAFVEEHRVQKFGQIVGDRGVQATAGAVLADGDPAEPPPAEVLAERERRERDLQQPKIDVVAARGRSAGRCPPRALGGCSACIATEKLDPLIEELLFTH